MMDGSAELWQLSKKSAVGTGCFSLSCRLLLLPPLGQTQQEARGKGGSLGVICKGEAWYSWKMISDSALWPLGRIKSES